MTGAEQAARLDGRLRAAGLDPAAVTRIVVAALEEDLGGGTDVTSEATIAPGATGTGRLVARQAGVAAGLPVAELVFQVAAELSGSAAPRTPQAAPPAAQPAAAAAGDLPAGAGNAPPEAAAANPPGGSAAGAGGTAQPFSISYGVADGERFAPGQVLLTVRGGVRGMLLAERTALNFACHLSGIATLTRRWVDEVAGTGTRIRDTRKTLPGLRALQKYAVRCGGGENHRMTLADAALVKDNHVAAAGGVAAAFAAASAALAGVAGRPGRRGGPSVEVECDTLAQVAEAVSAGAGLILLDNFTVEEMARAADLVAGRARLEASGGLSLALARAAAATGVDYLAIGAITHSAPAIDIGLDLAPGVAGR